MKRADDPESPFVFEVGEEKNKKRSKNFLTGGAHLI
jgi:hypothetical protein